jgi:hypothetical protein
MSSHLPLGYVCYRATSPPSINGRLTDAAWSRAPWTSDFVDIEGDAKPKPHFRTRAKMLWDDQYLYVGAELEEPHVWATLTKRDSVIFHDNDFEVFLDPDDDAQLYTEIEMNALNTVWDLLLVKPYRAGGPPLVGWDLHGIRTAVHVDGKLNDGSTTSKGWSVELAIPWADLRETARCPCPPRDGDQWRINFSRVEWDIDVANGAIRKIPNRPEHNWVWSPQGVVDMHRPERWGVLQFSNVATGTVDLKPHPGLEERIKMVEIWNAESDYRRVHGRWTTKLSDLGLDVPGAEIQTTRETFEISLGPYRLDHTQRFWRVSAE